MNWERLIQKRKWFGCGGFEHITCNYRNRESKKESLIHQPLNKFEVLSRRVINKEISSEREIKNNMKAILRKEKLKKKKKEKPVKVRKVENRELLREMKVKIGFKRIDIQKG